EPAGLLLDAGRGAQPAESHYGAGKPQRLEHRPEAQHHPAHGSLRPCPQPPVGSDRGPRHPGLFRWLAPLECKTGTMMGRPGPPGPGRPTVCRIRREAVNTLSHHQASAKIHAHNWFFPAAALYAAIVLPLSLQIMLTQPGWLPGLATGLGHGHEMLFGFALAVIAGY